MALYHVAAGYRQGAEGGKCCGQPRVKDSQGSWLAESQPPYVSAVNVNGLSLTTHTATVRNSR